MKEEIKFSMTYDDIMGNFVKSAVNASPYTCPDNLELVLYKAHERIVSLFEQKYITEMTYLEMKDFFLNEIICKIPECVEWNNRKNGRDGIGIVTRGHSPTPDDDFISLGAFARTIANDILFSRYNGCSIPDILGGIAKRRGA